MYVSGILNLSLLILKVLGGFPFNPIFKKPRSTEKGKEVWGDDENISGGNVRQNTTHSTPNSYFRPSKGWKLSSYFLAILHSVLLVCVWYAGLNRHFTIHTTRIAYFICDILSSLEGVVSVIYLMTYSSLALSIYTRLLHQWSQHLVTVRANAPSDWLFVLCVSIMTLGIFILPISSCLERDTIEFFIVSGIYEETLWFLLKLFIMGLLFSVVRLENIVYMDLRTSLEKSIEGQDGGKGSPNKSRLSTNEYMKMPTVRNTEIREHLNLGEIYAITTSKRNNKTDYKVLNQNTVSFSIPSDYSNRGEENNVSNLDQTNSIILGDYNIIKPDSNAAFPNTLDSVILKKTRRMLLELHAVHRLVLTYLGFPINLVVFNCLADGIVSSYYLFVVYSPNWISLISDVCFIFLTSLPLLVLFNLPVIIQSQVCIHFWLHGL